MAAIKRASSGTTMMMMTNMEQRNQSYRGSNDDEQQQRFGRRRKLSHSRVRFSDEQPTIHPPAAMEEEVIPPPSQDVVKLWYSREDIQQFLVERSNLAILLMNLDGSLPLQISEEDESRGLCLRGFEQYFSTSVRQQILARRIEHRTMVLMEQYRQLTDMGHRDPSLLRACIQHISQPAVDEALIIAALDTRAVSEDLAACRLFFPVPTATSPFTTSTTTTTMMPLSESTTTSGNHHSAHRRRVTPSPSFIDPSRSLKSLLSSSSASSASENVVSMMNHEWAEGPTVDGNSKLAPLSSLATSSTAIGNPVVIPLPNEQGLPSSLSMRFFIE